MGADFCIRVFLSQFTNYDNFYTQITPIFDEFLGGGGLWHPQRGHADAALPAGREVHPLLGRRAGAYRDAF